MWNTCRLSLCSDYILRLSCVDFVSPAFHFSGLSWVSSSCLCVSFLFLLILPVWVSLVDFLELLPVSAFCLFLSSVNTLVLHSILVVRIWVLNPNYFTYSFNWQHNLQNILHRQTKIEIVNSISLNFFCQHSTTSVDVIQHYTNKLPRDREPTWPQEQARCDSGQEKLFY